MKIKRAKQAQKVELLDKPRNDIKAPTNRTHPALALVVVDNEIQFPMEIVHLRCNCMEFCVLVPVRPNIAVRLSYYI